jgi:DNA-binding transcriptional MerR regulator
MFKIGDFSRVCRIPVSALRYYADIGLLEPASTDSFTGYRYYSLSQLPHLNHILALKDLGLSLTEIKTILDSNDELNVDELRGMLKLRQAELQQELADRQSQLDRVAARLIQIQEEGKMPDQEIVLKQIEKQTVLAYRFTAESSDVLGAMLGQIYPALFATGIMPASAPGILYHDPEFKADAIDVEVIYPVAHATESVKINDSVQMTARELPDTQVASIIHKGSYDGLESCYKALGQWIESNKYTIAASPRELYLTAPDDPDGAITEIQFPVAKA